VNPGCSRKQTLLSDLANEITLSFRSCYRILTDLNMQDFPQICTLPTDWWAISQSCQCVFHNLLRLTISFTDYHRGGDFKTSLQLKNNYRQSLKCKTSTNASSSGMNTGLTDPITTELLYI
jgi:hypothetical protein